MGQFQYFSFKLYLFIELAYKLQSYYFTMLISNSLGKNKIDYLSTSGGSSVFMRSDGFKKVVKGLSTTKTKIPDEVTHSKLHTSSGFRRFTKQYKLHPETETKCEIERTMTATKDISRRTTMFLGQAGLHNNDRKTVQFLKMEQEQEQCFRNICKVLNIVP